MKSWASVQIFIYIYIYTFVCHCRCYPRAFGSRLLDVWVNAEEVPHTPLRTALLKYTNSKCAFKFLVYEDVRMKVGVPPHLSDRELFESIPLGDPWHDAQVLEVWDYLWCHSKLEIPNSWHETMQQFDIEFRATVGWCHCWLMQGRHDQKYQCLCCKYLCMYCFVDFEVGGFDAKRARKRAKRARNRAKRAHKKICTTLVN